MFSPAAGPRLEIEKILEEHFETVLRETNDPEKARREVLNYLLDFHKPGTH